jgi:hypothetical protein
MSYVSCMISLYWININAEKDFRLHVMLIYPFTYLCKIWSYTNAVVGEVEVSWYDLLLNYIPRHRNLFVNLWLFNDALGNSDDVQYSNWTITEHKKYRMRIRLLAA